MRILSNHLPSLRALQCFIAVAQELNFRRAAEMLNMSQPPLSRQIQGIEDLLRVQLIERDTHRVRLTPAGLTFKKHVHAILASLDEAVVSLQSQAEERQSQAPRVCIGMTSVIDFSAFPGLAGSAEGSAPREGLRLEHAYSKVLVQRVKDGRLDIAIVGDIVAPSDELRVETVSRETMVVALAAGHPAASNTRVHLRDLGDTPLFWFTRADNPAFYDKCERVFSACGYAAPRRPEPTDFTRLLAAVAAGEGLALCPSSMQAASRVGVVYRRLDEALEPALAIDVQLVLRANESRPDVLERAQEIRDAVRPAPACVQPTFKPRGSVSRRRVASSES